MKAKSGVAKKIIIGLVSVLAIAAVVVVVLKLTGVLDINLSKKSKMVAGVEKLGETITDPVDKLSDSADENGTKIKVLDKINSDSAIEVSTEVSADIDEIKINDLSASEKASLKSAIEIINATKLGVDVRYDGDKSAYAKVNGKLDSTDISGEFLYDGKQAGVRSEELSSKWLTISEDDMNELMEESGVDVEEVKDILSKTMEKSDELASQIKIDDKKQKEIEERYTDVLKDFVNDKSKEMESEKATITVDGKDKKCTKVTLDLDDDDLKDLLKDYVNTFEKDKDLREILTNSANGFAEIMNETGSSEFEDIADYIDEIYNSLDDVKDEIDEIEFDGKATLVVYATTTNVYRTDIIISMDGATIKLAITYNKDTTVIDVSAKQGSDNIKIATITETSKEDEIGLRVEAGDFVKKEIGGDLYFDVNYKISKSKTEANFEFKAADYGEGKLSIVTNIDKNTENEYADTTTISIDTKVEDYVTAKLAVTIKSSIKVGDVSIPSISSKDTIDVTDEKAVEEYGKEVQENAEKLLKNLQKIDALEPIFEEVIDELM